jgi:hypothetical protein
VVDPKAIIDSPEARDHLNAVAALNASEPRDEFTLFWHRYESDILAYGKACVWAGIVQGPTEIDVTSIARRVLDEMSTKEAP